MNRTIQADGKRIDLYPAEGAAPLVLLIGEDGEVETLWHEVRGRTAADFSLAAVSGFDWNADLSPWPAPAVFRGEPPFAGGADVWLATLIGNLLPRIVKGLPQPPTGLAIAGYSLAGLFALYSLYRADLFQGAVCASGSLWYPGFLEYAKGHDFASPARAVYLSVGDREARTRNPVMKPVEENARQLAEWYAGMGVDARFELNPGNHFQDPSCRLAKGIAWLLDRPEEP